MRIRENLIVLDIGSHGVYIEACSWDKYLSYLSSRISLTIPCRHTRDCITPEDMHDIASVFLTRIGIHIFRNHLALPLRYEVVIHTHSSIIYLTDENIEHSEPMLIGYVIPLIIALTRWDDDDLLWIFIGEEGSYDSTMSDMWRVECSAENIYHIPMILSCANKSILSRKSIYCSD